jgi:hypothetical protein
LLNRSEPLRSSSDRARNRCFSPKPPDRDFVLAHPDLPFADTITAQFAAPAARAVDRELPATLRAVPVSCPEHLAAPTRGCGALGDSWHRFEDIIFQRRVATSSTSSLSVEHSKPTLLPASASSSSDSTPNRPGLFQDGPKERARLARPSGVRGPVSPCSARACGDAMARAFRTITHPVTLTGVDSASSASRNFQNCSRFLGSQPSTLDESMMRIAKSAFASSTSGWECLINEDVT